MTETGQNGSSRVSAWHLVVLVLSFLSLLPAYFLSFGSLDAERREILLYADTAVCLIFLIDFFVHLIKAPSKSAYLRWGWIDLLTCIPAAPFLRFARILRIIRLIRMIRLFKGVGHLRGMVQHSRSVTALSFVLTCAFVAAFVGALVAFEFEHPTGNITTGRDALWWSFVTMTTVGYGDHFPITPQGRVMAVILMLLGVTLLGTATGYIANWFDKPEDSEDRDRDERILREIKELRREIEELKSQTAGEQEARQSEEA